MWDLISEGYASMVTLSVRKLVDKDSRADSLWHVVRELEKRPELITRECYVCHDGIPYDYQKVEEERLEQRRRGELPLVGWVDTEGPKASGTSELMHEAFDKLAGVSIDSRKKLQRIDGAVVDNLKGGLQHPAIKNVSELASRKFAHAERVTPGATPIPQATYNEVDEALKQLVKIASFISSHVFYDVAFGSVVPVPQYDVLEALDLPWVNKALIPALHDYWSEASREIDGWAADGDQFLSM